MKAIVIKAIREGYDLEDVADDTLTVGQLLEMLSGCNVNAPVCLSFDKGYTYGAITESRISLRDF